MESSSQGTNRTDVPSFTHLKVYSSYSLGVGLNTPAELCAAARRLGYSSLALTDVCGTYGYVEFHSAAREHGVKPIYGIVLRHRPASRRTEVCFEMTLLAVSREGLGRVARLATLAAKVEEGGGPIPIEVIGANAEGVVAFAGAAGSEVGRLVLMGEEDDARRAVGVLKEIFGERFFIEVQDHGHPEERGLARKLVGLAAVTGTPPLLTHEVRYVEKGSRELYGALRSVRDFGEGRDFFRAGDGVGDWAMRSPSEMEQLRPFYGPAFDNAGRVAEMVPGDLMDPIETEWPDGKERGSGEWRKEILDRCAPALRKRLDQPSADGPTYRAILEREVGEAVEEGIAPTLLFFHRVLWHLRETGVDVGPATGIALQSLCAYLLAITSFDPYRFDPRFYPDFHRGRAEAHEFELQVTPESRSAAVHALFSLFGKGQVAYLPAVERITPLKAVRMAAAVVEVPESEYREIRAVFERHPGISIEKIYEQDESLGRLYRRSLAARDLLRRAGLLEDLPVGFIRSRRSLALSPVPLTDFLGHSFDSDTGDLFVQAGREVFPVGRVFRVDLTSLGALSVALRSDEALRKKGLGGYGWEGFATEDIRVWDRIQSGDPTGIFLFEGATTLKRRDSFELRRMEDLVLFLALMRTHETGASAAEAAGSLQWSRREVAYPASEAERVGDILRLSRGRILYDEQVRDIVCALTGLPPSEGWKIFHELRDPSPGPLAAGRARFMMGAAEKGVAPDSASRWFECLLRVAKTTTSYRRVFADALLVYKLFFLKTHHESVFYAALLDSTRENEGRSKKYLEVLAARGLLLPVDINRSDVGFSDEDGRIRTGLCAVRGVDEEKARRVVEARAKGPFDSIGDFYRRVGRKYLGRRDIRALVEAGAFDSLGIARGELRRTLQELFRGGRQRVGRDGDGQLELPLGG